MTVAHVRNDSIERAADPFRPELARVSPQQLSGSDQFDRMARWLDLFMRTAEVSKVLARTAFVPDPMRDKPEDIAACMMRALELGIDPLDGLASMYVVKGKVGFSAEFMRRRVLEAGHEIVFEEQTDERCKVRGRRAGSSEWTTVVFTKAQAEKAGVQNLQKFAADMLVARASSRLCRRVFPDVLSGAQIIEDIVDGIVIEAEPADGGGQPAAGSRQVLQRKPRAARKTTVERVAPQQVPAADLDEFPAIADQSEPAPADEAQAGPPADVEYISDAQMKKLHVLFNAEGLDDRESRLAWCAQAISRDITSSKDLTKAEASSIIDILENAQQQGN
jgi:hypothetical protein